MAYEHLWQNEAWRKAFQRWWDEDWSWEGLGRKHRRPSLGDEPRASLGTLQEVWRDEEQQNCLLDFGGRRWTRFHLPPFDRGGTPCPGELWGEAKNASCRDVLRTRLKAAKAPDDAAREKIRPGAVTDFAELGGVVFPEDFEYGGGTLVADLQSVVFLGRFEFSQRVLARFDGATFADDAKFGGARFSKDAWFDGATFSGDARFDGTTPFPKGAIFRSARFRRKVDFSGREFKERTDFSGAWFNGVPKFHGAKLHPDTSFQSARFPGEGLALPPLRLRWFRPEGSVLAEREKEVREAARDRLGRWKRWRWRIGPRKWRSRPWKAMRFGGVPFALRWDRKLKAVRKANDSDAEEYEIAYRQLRRLCAEIGSIEYEGRFHALELKAHRARTDTQIPARIASWLYEKLSDYGRSMGRPLLWLAGGWGTFALWYGLVFMPPYRTAGPGLTQAACGAIKSLPRWPDVFVAAGREFLPALFGMADAANRPEWLRCAEGARPLLFFFTGALQIVVFIACVSLFLIALRRRFQLRD